MAHQAPQTNPLALIGRNRPKPVDNDALRKLQTSGAIQSLANKGGLDRQALANIGARNTAGVPLGLNFDDPDINRKLEALRQSTMSLRGGQAINQAAGGGVQTTFPSSFTLGQTQNQPFGGGNPLKGEAQSLALPRVEAKAEQGRTVRSERTLGPNRKPVGITTKEIVTETEKVEGKRRNDPLADKISTDLLNAAKIRFPGVQITESSFNILNDGTIILSIPGQAPIVVGER